MFDPRAAERTAQLEFIDTVLRLVQHGASMDQAIQDAEAVGPLRACLPARGSEPGKPLPKPRRRKWRRY